MNRTKGKTAHDGMAKSLTLISNPEPRFSSHRLLTFSSFSSHEDLKSPLVAIFLDLHPLAYCSAGVGIGESIIEFSTSAISVV